MTETEIRDRVRSLGFPVNVTVLPMSEKADNVLKGIILNPTCRGETRMAALAELERRKNPPVAIEQTA